MVLEIKLNLNIFVEAQDIKTPRQILENLPSAEEQTDMSTVTEIPELQSKFSRDIQAASVLFTLCLKKSKRLCPSAVLDLWVSVPILTLKCLFYLCHSKNLNLELIPSLPHNLQLSGFLLFFHI